MTNPNYVKLINSVKGGDINAYNALCVEFLDYVPMIVEDFSVLLNNSHLDIDDIHQEGYLAICESIQEIVKSDKQYTPTSISKTVMGNIILRIMNLLREQRNYDDHIILSDIQYDTFKQFLNSIREDPNFKQSCVTFILSEY